ncbi:MAG: hypothetical protein ACPIA5_03835, partial [Flavobacteriales bacterium]
MSRLLKRILALAAFVASSSLTSAQTTFFEHPDFPRRALQHEKIAFIPFEVSVNLRPKEMKNMT